MDIAAAGAAFAVVAVLIRYADAALRAPMWAAHAVSVASALAATVAPGDPTGWIAADVLLRALLGFALAWAAARVRLGWLLASAIVVGAALFFAESPVSALGFAAAGVPAALLAAGTTSPVLQAIAGAFVAQTALRLEWDDRLGASLAAGTVATLLLILPGLAHLGRGARRGVRWAIAGAVLVGLGGSAVAAVSAATVYRDVDRAITIARRGIDRLSDDEAAAAEDLREAATLFADAQDVMNAWWARPARAVPIVAQHSRAVATLAGAGADLATTAAEALDAADPDRVRLADGTIDLDALRELQGPLGAARASLDRATEALDEVESPWLLAPLAERYDELVGEVELRRDDVEMAALAAEVAPGLLGADGPRRYFLAIETPAELRAGGGVLGNFGEITAIDGQLDLVRFGRTQELNESGVPRDQRQLDLPADVEDLYAGTFGLPRFWQNIAVSPDLSVEADIVRQLYPQSGGTEIDGIIVADPHAIAAILEITGPVRIEGVEEELTADNAVPFLMHEQYVRYETDARVDLLGDAAEVTWERLTTGSLPGPGALIDALGPAVAGGHLQVFSFHEEDAELLRRSGLDGVLRPPVADGFGVFLQNGGLNKIDWFLRRRVAYRAAWDPATGQVDGTLSITLRNDAPASGLPDSVIRYGGAVDETFQTVPGENGGLLTLYTALPTGEVRIDGQPAPVAHRGRDGPWHVTMVFTRVPAQSEVTVEVEVAGAIAGTYALDLLRQPVANPDEVDLEVVVQGGWRPVDVKGFGASAAGATVRAAGPLAQPERVEFGLRDA